MSSGGEQYQEAFKHSEVFSSLVAQLGWEKRGRIDQKLEGMLKVKTKKSEKNRDLNVDLLFTFYCPISERERGVLVDSKRYAMQSISNSKLQEFLDKNAVDIDNLRISDAILESELGINRAVVFDTSIVSIYVHKEWDNSAMLAYLRQLKAPAVRQSPMLSMIGANNILERLSTISNLKKRCRKLEFFYCIAGNSCYSTVLVPEYLFSLLIPIRYELYSEPEGYQRYGIILFDLEKPYRDSARFSLGFARRVFSSQTEVNLLCVMDHSEFITFQQEVQTAINKIHSDQQKNVIRPTFPMEVLDVVPYRV